MKKIKIIGNYITKFGELWDRSLESLFEEAVFGSLNSVLGSKFVNKTMRNEYGTVCKIPKYDQTKIDAVFVSNMAGGQFSKQSHLNALVSDMLIHNPPGFRVEASCASGGIALEMAELALLSGKYQTVLVVGAEKMTDVLGGESTKILSGASEYQKEYGSTFPALYALLAKSHMDTFGTTREQLSMVASKNHKHALNNSKAQFRKEILSDVVSKSTVIADPIRLLDCSPVSDGASAVILTTKNTKEYKNKPVLEAVGHGQDSLSLANRDSLTQLKSTKIAAQQVYEKLKIKASDISFAEVHDCFTIAEILACEDLGFFKKGAGGTAIELGKTTYGEVGKYVSNTVINPSGGLNACGHPVGATGVKQVAFLAELLEKNKSDLDEILPTKHKQNKKIYALAHNVGGSGATAIVHVLSRKF
jgi:acetyl-CoA C-acetyltransferase